MPGPDDRFRWNAADAVADVIDGEAILMNLSRGVYYSADQSGAAIWTLLAAGSSAGEAASAIAGRYGIPAAQAREDVARFAARLLEEGLLLPASDRPAPPDPVALDGFSGAYRAPELRSYGDMKNLLALDPPLPGYRGAPGA